MDASNNNNNQDNVRDRQRLFDGMRSGQQAALLEGALEANDGAARAPTPLQGNGPSEADRRAGGIELDALLTELARDGNSPAARATSVQQGSATPPAPRTPRASATDVIHRGQVLGDAILRAVNVVRQGAVDTGNTPPMMAPPPMPGMAPPGFLPTPSGMLSPGMFPPGLYAPGILPPPPGFRGSFFPGSHFPPGYFPHTPSPFGVPPPPMHPFGVPPPPMHPFDVPPPMFWPMPMPGWQVPHFGSMPPMMPPPSPAFHGPLFNGGFFTPRLHAGGSTQAGFATPPPPPNTAAVRVASTPDSDVVIVSPPPAALDTTSPARDTSSPAIVYSPPTPRPYSTPDRNAATPASGFAYIPSTPQPGNATPSSVASSPDSDLAYIPSTPQPRLRCMAARRMAPSSPSPSPSPTQRSASPAPGPSNSVRSSPLEDRLKALQATCARFLAEQKDLRAIAGLAQEGSSESELTATPPTTSAVVEVATPRLRELLTEPPSRTFVPVRDRVREIEAAGTSRFIGPSRGPRDADLRMSEATRPIPLGQTHREQAAAEALAQLGRRNPTPPTSSTYKRKATDAPPATGPKRLILGALENRPTDSQPPLPKRQFLNRPMPIQSARDENRALVSAQGMLLGSGPTRAPVVVHEVPATTGRSNGGAQPTAVDRGAQTDLQLGMAGGSADWMHRGGIGLNNYEVWRAAALRRAYAAAIGYAGRDASPDLLLEWARAIIVFLRKIRAAELAEAYLFGVTMRWLPQPVPNGLALLSAYDWLDVLSCVDFYDGVTLRFVSGALNRLIHRKSSTLPLRVIALLVAGPTNSRKGYTARALKADTRTPWSDLMIKAHTSPESMLLEVLSKCEGFAVANLVLNDMTYNEKVMDALVMGLQFVTVSKVFVNGVASGNDEVPRLLETIPGLRDGVVFKNDVRMNAAAVLSVCAARKIPAVSLRYAGDVTDAQIVDFVFDNSARVAKQFGILCLHRPLSDNFFEMIVEKCRRHACESLRFGIAGIQRDPTDAKYDRFVVERNKRAVMYKFDKETDVAYTILVVKLTRFYLRVFQGSANELCSSIDAARKIPTCYM